MPWSEGRLNNPSAGNHAVQFYEDDELLLEVVARFAAAGLAAGEPVVIIATEEHRVYAFSAHPLVQGQGTSLDRCGSTGTS